MTTPTPTPGPWTLYEAGHPTDQVFDSAGVCIVADCKWTKFTPRQREINAAHIVHCVNTHPALVAALELAYNRAQGFHDLDPEDCHLIEAALARAQKG